MLGSFSQNKKPTLICCFFAFVAVSETDYFLSRDLYILYKSQKKEKICKNTTFD